MSAQTRERPAPAGRPFAERISHAPNPDNGTSDVPGIRDPRRIAGAAVRKYGLPLAHQIACEMSALVDAIENGAPAVTREIPAQNRDAAQRGAAQCRQAIASVRDRMGLT